MFAPLCIAAAAGIILALGLVHLVYTFRGPKLRPRDPALEAAMRSGFPGLTRQTTIWKSWVGFNASHSLGAILFGLAYAHLALFQPEVLFGSPFLCTLGALALAGYLALGVAYWFSIPRRGIAIACALFAAGLLLRWAA